MTCQGFCKSCQKVHSLGSEESSEQAQLLMSKLREHKRVDFDSANAEVTFSTDYLYGPAKGQMFAVMTCLNADGEIVTLKAFSGQYNGQWIIPGWVPPIIDRNKYNDIMIPGDKTIKGYGAKMKSLTKGSCDYLSLKKERKECSKNLMKQIHGLYRLYNFKGQSSSLEKAFIYEKGIPTGTADCCAPKLLNFAAKMKYRPLSISEFYWGKTNASGSKLEGEFYDSCEEKCQPILGFLLCGLDDE